MTNIPKFIDFSGSNDITEQGIKKHFKNIEPWQPISELAWNGFDADAMTVSITIRETEANGTDSVTILDNGKGIDFLRPQDNFRRFNDSLKKDSYSQHGSQGRGRLAFHKICNSATWFTRFQGLDAKIDISSSSLRSISGTTIPAEQQNALLADYESGTCVELYNFANNLPSESAIRNELSLEFGWHLILYPEKTLLLNGIPVPAPAHTKTPKTIKIDNYIFDVDLIQWNEKPNSEKSFNYLVGTKGSVVYHEYSSLNKKPDFHTSIYIRSEWADCFIANENELAPDIQSLIDSKLWRQLNKELNKFTQEYYNEFLIKLADAQIDLFVQEGDFPDYNEMDESYSNWRFNNTKKIVRSIILTDPRLLKKSSKRQRKIIIRLLDKISVSSENESLLEVLESVLDLDSKAMNKFADQLKKSRLDNIIQTIEVLQKRELAVRRISEIMRNHYKETLETPDLQKVIESNTWLFGSQYETIGAEEDTFTTIAKNLRDSVKGINSVDAGDIDDGATVEGANRQVDLFLVRRSLQLDSLNKPFFRCVILEIKRPSIALNKHHLRQIDDYAGILSKHPEFNGINTKYEIVLVGRKISSADYDINDRLESHASRNEPGLLGVGQIKRYVKTWQTIIEEFKISSHYLLDVLKTQRDTLENSTKQSLLDELHKKTA